MLFDSESLYLSFFFLKDSFAKYSVLGWQFFLWHLKYIIPFFPGLQGSLLRNPLLGIPMYMMSWFSLAVFKIPSLTFENLLIMCIGEDLYILCLGFLGLHRSGCSFPSPDYRLVKFSVIISLNKFSSFLYLYFGTPINMNIVSFSGVL